MLALDGQDLDRAIPDERERELNIDPFPGLFPQACGWIESLPEAFIAAPSLERAIAERILNVSAEALRRECSRITPKLARALRWMARKLDRTPFWIGGVPRDGPWTEWCGGRA